MLLSAHAACNHTQIQTGFSLPGHKSARMTPALMVLSFFGLLLIMLTILGARIIRRSNQGLFYRRIVDLYDLQEIVFPQKDLTAYKKKWFFEYGFCMALVENRLLRLAALSLIEQDVALVLEPGHINGIEPDTDHKVHLALHLSEELQKHGAREIVLHGVSLEYSQRLAEQTRVRAIAAKEKDVDLLKERIGKTFSDWQPLEQGQLYLYAGD